MSKQKKQNLNLNLMSLLSLALTSGDQKQKDEENEQQLKEVLRSMRPPVIIPFKDPPESLKASTTSVLKGIQNLQQIRQPALFPASPYGPVGWELYYLRKALDYMKFGPNEKMREEYESWVQWLPVQTFWDPYVAQMEYRTMEMQLDGHNFVRRAEVLSPAQIIHAKIPILVAQFPEEKVLELFPYYDESYLPTVVLWGHEFIYRAYYDKENDIKELPYLFLPYYLTESLRIPDSLLSEVDAQERARYT